MTGKEKETSLYQAVYSRDARATLFRLSRRAPLKLSVHTCICTACVVNEVQTTLGVEGEEPLIDKEVILPGQSAQFTTKVYVFNGVPELRAL